MNRLSTLGIAMVMAVLGLLWCASPLFAETRIALVVGNAAYSKGGELTNPVHDANLISATLAKVGFDVVAVKNASYRDTKLAIRQFTDKITKATDPVVLFYYAGHGVQVNGRNYLLPIDATMDSVATLEMDAIEVDSVMRMMNEAGGRFIIMILDACRNNPFPARTRSMSRGLARIEAPVGSLIAYATAPGTVAMDGTGKNSPFSEALAQEMVKPNLSIEKLFRNVRNSVLEKTSKAQIPWESSSLVGGDFFFNPQAETPPPVAEIPTVAEKPPAVEPVALKGKPETRAKSVAQEQPVPHDHADEKQEVDDKPDLRSKPDKKELARWEKVRTSTKPRELRAFLKAHPEGVFADVAAARLAALEARDEVTAQEPEVKPAPPPPPPPPPPPKLPQKYRPEMREDRVPEAGLGVVPPPSHGKAASSPAQAVAEVALSNAPLEYYAFELATSSFVAPDIKSERLSMHHQQDDVVQGRAMRKGWVQIGDGAAASFVPAEVLHKVSPDAAHRWQEIRKSDNADLFHDFAETYSGDYLAGRAKALERYFVGRQEKARQDFFNTLLGNDKGRR